jgi:carbohydrate-selective porin OprB
LAAACLCGLLCAGAPDARSASFGLPIETSAPAPAAEEQTPPEAVLSPGDLLDAFHRWRAHLKDYGITFSVHERSEVWANLTGGGHQGTSYDGLTIAKLDVDLDKAVGWSGAEFFASAFDIHGHGPGRSLVGNLQLVSNIEAAPSLKLYDLWLDQSLFDKTLSIRLGQEGANDEMMTTTYGGLFLNSSFGFPGMPAAVLPSGGPNYPLATPFVRAQLKPNDKVKIIGAIYNGDPAPPGPGDPQTRDRNGTAFRLDDHALGFGEVWYSPDPSASAALPTTYKLGAWYSVQPVRRPALRHRGRAARQPGGLGARAYPYRRLGVLWHRRSDGLAAPRREGSGHRGFSANHGRTERPQHQQLLRRRRHELAGAVPRAPRRRSRNCRHLSRHKPGGAQLQPRSGFIRPSDILLCE